MSFTCQQCGECCSSMGEIIEITEQAAPTIFTIRYTTTNEQRTVVVDADKKDLFFSQGIPAIRHLACPFLREKMPGKRICMVHDSRPELCRQYSCFRVLVADQSGKRIGRVWDGSRYFTTADPALRELWNRDIAGQKIADEQAWEDFVVMTLTACGYRIVR